MKTVSFFVLSLLLISAQYSLAQSIDVGPRFGLNLSQLNGLPINGTRPGFVIGGFITYHHNTHVGFSADLLISSKGARSTSKFTTNTGSEKWDYYFNLIYLEMPLLANFYLGNQRQLLRPKLFIGPSIAYKLEATHSLVYTKDETMGNFSTYTNNQCVSSKYKNTDLGIMVGFGFNYHMGRHAFLNFDSRYTFGVRNVNYSNQIHPLYNRNFAMLLGIGYQIGK